MRLKKQKTFVRKVVPNGRGTLQRALTKADTICRHDYKNAIQIGNVDYVCPLIMGIRHNLNPSNSTGLKDAGTIDGQRMKIIRLINPITAGFVGAHCDAPCLKTLEFGGIKS